MPISSQEAESLMTRAILGEYPKFTVKGLNFTTKAFEKATSEKGNWANPALVFEHEESPAVSPSRTGPALKAVTVEYARGQLTITPEPTEKYHNISSDTERFFTRLEDALEMVSRSVEAHKYRNQFADLERKPSLSTCENLYNKFGSVDDFSDNIDAIEVLHVDGVKSTGFYHVYKALTT